jgi:hypothetical protein
LIDLILKSGPTIDHSQTKEEMGSEFQTVGMEVGFPFPAQNQSENINGL